MLPKYDQYLAQLGKAEATGFQNVRASIADCFEQEWLQVCILT